MRDKTRYLDVWKQNSLAVVDANEQDHVPVPETDGKTYTGRIKSFVAEKGWGFIKSDELSQNPFVHQDDADGLLHVGDLVSFQNFSGDKGPRAINVHLLKKHSIVEGARGRVLWFDQIRAFGFVESEGKQVWYHLKNVICGWNGHRCDVRAGTEVLFVLHETDRLFATDIRPVERSEHAVAVLAPPEFSRVVRWDPLQKFGHVERSCGEIIHFSGRVIKTTGVEELKVGDYVQHRVMRCRDGHPKACEVVLFETGFVPPKSEPVYSVGSIEEHFANIPDEPQPEPAPVEPRIYDEVSRRTPLRELIKRKKKVAA